MNPNNQMAPENITSNILPRKTLAEKMANLQLQKQKLAQKTAALNKEARKERDGQLIAWGIMVEARYRNATPDLREHIISTTRELLKDRNLSRALAGFARLDAETSPEEA